MVGEAPWLWDGFPVTSNV